jgi:2-methylcitrate dehydratase PrpD
MCKLQELVVTHDIMPDQVERLAVRTNRVLPVNLTYHRPTTGLQGKFSMEFCLAAILTLRRAGLTEFTDTVVNRPHVQQAIGKIDYSVYSDEEAAAQGYALLTTFLDIMMKDGRRFSARADAAKGSAGIPMNEDELAGKFRECAEFADWGVQRAEKLIELILHLEELDDVRALTELLRSGE